MNHARRNRQIRRLHARGITRDRIAAGFNMTPTAVSNVLARARQAERRIIVLHEQGLSRAKIAKQLGITWNKVRWALDKHGLTAPRVSVPLTRERYLGTRRAVKWKWRRLVIGLPRHVAEAAAELAYPYDEAPR